MSIQSARENAVLDALVQRTRTVSEVMAALDGHGMLASPRGVSDILSGLTARGLVTRSGTAYRLTPSGLESVRRRKAGPAARARPAAAP